MAVRQAIATGLPDLTAAKPGKADVRINHGVLRTATSVISILSGDSPTSQFVVARIPSHARISKLSKIHSGGVAGLTDADLGVSADPDCLVDGQTLAATATVEGASAIAVADFSKPLWQLAGLASDPKEEMEVLLTMNAAATGPGDVQTDLVYICE